MTFSRSYHFLILFLCALLIQSASALALDINKVRFGAHSDKTRIVLELDQETEFRSFMLPKENDKPYRLVVDLPDFNWKAGTIKSPPQTDILDVRSGALKAGMKRLVIDLEKPAQIKAVFFLPAKSKQPNRLVIDYKSVSKSLFTKTKRTPIGTLPDTSGDLNLLIASQTLEDIAPIKKSTLSSNVLPTRKPETTETKAKKNVIKLTDTSKSEKVAPKKAPPTPAVKKEVKSKKTTPATKAAPIKTPLRKPLIVIDAGHGGQDPGASGAENQREKNITLAAAKTLKIKLEKTGRYRVHLTRSSDKYIKLYKRVSIARNKEADLFISLHADSIGKSHVRGASIYTLSNKSSDVQTAKLAKRENQADLIAGVDLSHEDKDVANILIDLTMRDTMNQSKFFANTVVDHMRNRGIRILTRPHRYAGFAVLKAPDVPSVLFEMGFMSNRDEARLLSTNSYREKIAAALTDSVDAYFQKVAKNNR